MSKPRFLLIELTSGFEMDNIGEILNSTHQWDPFTVSMYGDIETAQDDARHILETRAVSTAILKIETSSVVLVMNTKNLESE